MTLKIYTNDHQMIKVHYDLKLYLIPNQLNCNSCRELKLHSFYHQFVHLHFKQDVSKTFYFAHDTIETLQLVVSPKEHIEDNLDKFINNRTIAD